MAKSASQAVADRGWNGLIGADDSIEHQKRIAAMIARATADIRKVAKYGW